MNFSIFPSENEMFEHGVDILPETLHFLLFLLCSFNLYPIANDFREGYLSILTPVCRTNRVAHSRSRSWFLTVTNWFSLDASFYLACWIKALPYRNRLCVCVCVSHSAKLFRYLGNIYQQRYSPYIYFRSDYIRTQYLLYYVSLRNFFYIKRYFFSSSSSTFFFF